MPRQTLLRPASPFPLLLQYCEHGMPPLSPTVLHTMALCWPCTQVLAVAHVNGGDGGGGVGGGDGGGGDGDDGGGACGGGGTKPFGAQQHVIALADVAEQEPTLPSL